MSDISQLASRGGGGGERGIVANFLHITTLPGSGRGAGRGLRSLPLGRTRSLRVDSIKDGWSNRFLSTDFGQTNEKQRHFNE